MDLLPSELPLVGHSGVRASWSVLSAAVGNFRVTRAGSASAVRIVAALRSLEAIQHLWVAALKCFAVEAGQIDSARAVELECWTYPL